MFERVVFNMHGTITTLSSRRAKSLERMYKIIASSSKVAEGLYAAGVPEEKVRVISNGVPLHAFDACDAEVLNEYVPITERTAPHTVIYVGGFYPWKGVHILAEATQYLIGIADVILVGATDAECAVYREEFPYANLHVLPYVSPRITPCMLAAADVVVLPNIETEHLASKDTAPIKLFWCLASGTPTIVSDIPALRALTNDAEVIFVTPGDGKILADAILTHFTAPEVGAYKAAHAKARTPTFSWEARAREVVEYIT